MRTAFGTPCTNTLIDCPAAGESGSNFSLAFGWFVWAWEVRTSGSSWHVYVTVLKAMLCMFNMSFATCHSQLVRMLSSGWIYVVLVCTQAALS